MTDFGGALDSSSKQDADLGYADVAYRFKLIELKTEYVTKTCKLSSEWGVSIFDLGLDGISALLITLTTFLISLCILYSWSIDNLDHLRFMLAMLFFLEATLIFAFLTLDIFGFFLFFEATLIPMFLILAYFGPSKRRIKASFYLLLYTLIGSICMFFAICYIQVEVGSTHLLIVQNHKFTTFAERSLWFCFFIAFAVKISYTPLVLWLPESDSTDLTIVSILLVDYVSIVTSLYGFLRFLEPVFPEASAYFLPLLFA